MEENDIRFTKEEKLFMVLGFVFVLLVRFIVFPSFADSANQKETEFAQNFFTKYQSYDDIETDYIPNENTHITVDEEYPSGKMVSIRNDKHSTRYFIKKDMSYYHIDDKKYRL